MQDRVKPKRTNQAAAITKNGAAVKPTDCIVIIKVKISRPVIDLKMHPRHYTKERPKLGSHPIEETFSGEYQEYDPSLNTIRPK